MCVEDFVCKKHMDFHIDSVNEMKKIFFKHCVGSSIQFPRHRLSLVGIYYDCHTL